MRLETRYDNENREFVLITERANGETRVERFKEMTAFRTRLAAVETELASAEWLQHGDPTYLRDGWKL